MRKSVLLYCIVLFCIEVYCIVLYWNVMYISLCCIVLLFLVFPIIIIIIIIITVIVIVIAVIVVVLNHCTYVQICTSCLTKFCSSGPVILARSAPYCAHRSRATCHDVNSANVLKQYVPWSVAKRLQNNGHSVRV